MTAAATNRLRDERWARTVKVIARDGYATPSTLFADGSAECFQTRDQAAQYLQRRAERGLLAKAVNRAGFEIHGRYVLPAGREAM